MRSRDQSIHPSMHQPSKCNLCPLRRGEHAVPFGSDPDNKSRTRTSYMFFYNSLIEVLLAWFYWSWWGGGGGQEGLPAWLIGIPFLMDNISLWCQFQEFREKPTIKLQFYWFEEAKMWCEVPDTFSKAALLIRNCWPHVSPIDSRGADGCS